MSDSHIDVEASLGLKVPLCQVTLGCIPAYVIVDPILMREQFGRQSVVISSRTGDA